MSRYTVIKKPGALMLTIILETGNRHIQSILMINLIGRVAMAAIVGELEMTMLI